MKIPHHRFTADAARPHASHHGVGIPAMAYQQAVTPAPHLGAQQLPNYGEFLYPGAGIVLSIPSKNHNNYATTIVEPSVVPPIIGDPTGASASSSYPNGEVGDPTSVAGGLNVRAEEVGLVLLVLMLWAGAVALFFNRWGKIRMLEPYQPKFIDAPRGSLAVAANSAATPLVMSGVHRPSYPIIEIAHQSRSHPHHSRLNVSSSGACCACGEDHQMSACSASAPGRRRTTSPSLHLLSHHHHRSAFPQSSPNRLSPGMPSLGYERPRQNSVVVFATAHFMTAARRVKSAMDLQTLVLREETEESVHALVAAGAAGGSTNNAAGSSGSGVGPVPTCDLSEAAITCV